MHLGHQGHLERGRTSMLARTYCRIMLLFLRSWNFCTHREILVGKLSTRYSTQIYALRIFRSLC